MANRTMLYGIGGYAADEPPETVHPISEAAYTIPFNYLVLISGNTRPVPSLIFEGGPALLGEYRIGLQRFHKLAGLIRIMGRDTSRLITALDKFETALDQKRSDYFLCEPLEVLAMAHAKEEWPELIQTLARDAMDWGDWIDSIEGSEAEQIEIMQTYFSAPGGDPNEAAEIVLDEDFDDNDRDDAMLQLFTSDVLYFTIPTRTEVAARQSEPGDPE